jgi:cytochrome c-type biogenesis protein
VFKFLNFQNNDNRGNAPDDGNTSLQNLGLTRNAAKFLLPALSVAGLILLFIGGYYLYINYVGGLFSKAATAGTVSPYLLMGLAVVGGAASFFSPCSIAITPSLLAYFTGRAQEHGGEGAGQRQRNQDLQTAGQQTPQQKEQQRQQQESVQRRLLATSGLLAFGILSFYAFASFLVGWIGALVYNFLIYFIPAVGLIFWCWDMQF